MAAQLAEVGVDPLDLAAAEVARTALVRKFVLDALLIFAIVAVVAPVALMVARAVGGGDPLAGREIFIASGALVLLVVVAVVLYLTPPRAGAYEKAWNSFVQLVWPGTRGGDELGRGRLAFVRRMHGGAQGEFPAVAPGRRG